MTATTPAAARHRTATRAPAVTRRPAAPPLTTFATVPGGTRARRRGKPGHVLITRDDRSPGERYHVVRNGDGVVGAIEEDGGSWILDVGTFRGWSYLWTSHGPFRLHPDACVHTEWLRSKDEAMARAAKWFCS